MGEGWVDIKLFIIGFNAKKNERNCKYSIGIFMCLGTYFKEHLLTDAYATR